MSHRRNNPAAMETSLRILIVEDSEDDALLILREIEKVGFQVEMERVETRPGLQAALEQPWNLVICDYSLPHFNALYALEVLHASGKDLPFIILSGSIGEDAAVAALKAGAHDFISKTNLARLIPAVQRELREAEIRRERKQTEADLRESERQMRALVNSLDDIVLECDRQGVYLNVWGSSEHLLVRPKAEIHAHKIVDLLGEELGRSFLEALGRVLDSGRTEDLEYPLDLENRRHWFLAHISPVLAADGSRQTASILVRDVTIRKQTEAKIKQHLAELEAIASTSAALGAAQTFDEVLPRLLQEALQQVSAVGGSIWMFDSHPRLIRRVYESGIQFNTPATTLPGEGIVGLAFQSGDVILSHDLRRDVRIEEQDRANIPEGLNSACLPLSSADKTIGALLIAKSLPDEFDPGELNILSTLASIGGSALDRTALHEQTIRQLERLSALHAIDRTITASLDLNMTLSVVLEQVIRQLNIDATDILLLQQGSQRLEYVSGKGFRTRGIESTSLRLGEGLAGRAALEREILHVEDLSSTGEGLVRGNLLHEEKFISCHVVPLITKGKVKGVLEIFNRTKLGRDAEWQQFLEALSVQAAIAIDNASLFQDLQRSNLDLTLAYDATIEGWSRALDLRDKETEGHTRRVTETTLKLAQSMGFRDEELIHVRRGALLHDIGKMGVPDRILLKPGKLTDDEWRQMRRHPELAFEMLRPIAYLRPALDIPYCHHEKWDGTGYPQGLQGERIPLAARLFAVVDVWDALSFDRPYRAAWNRQEVLDYILEQSGKHFDPKVVDIFLKLIATP